MKITEDLANWGDEYSNYPDLLHEHFEKTNLWDWCDVAKEGRSVFNQMFQDDVEEDSPIDCVFAAIAAQVAHGAFAAIARMLGTTPGDIERLSAYWYENKDKTPPPLQIGDKLNKYIEDLKKYEDSIEASDAESPVFIIPENQK